MKGFTLGALTMWLLMRWVEHRRQVAEIDFQLAIALGQLKAMSSLSRPVAAGERMAQEYRPARVSGSRRKLRLR